MEEKEIWKDVIGYEGLYQVSNFGRIKSLPKEKKTPTTTFMTKETILNQHKDNGGYFRVMLTKKGKSILKSVHVIVASAFIGERGNLTVNHKDENKANNNINNLEYLTRAENVRYGTGIIRSAKNRQNNPNIGIAVNQFNLDGTFVARYKSASFAIKLNGWKGCGSNILECCRKKKHTFMGFVWRFDGDTNIEFERKTNAKGVLQFTKDGVFIGEYKSLTDAEMATHTQKAHICDCCKGNRKYANGFLWKYKD